MRLPSDFRVGMQRSIPLSSKTPLNQSAWRPGTALSQPAPGRPPGRSATPVSPLIWHQRANCPSMPIGRSSASVTTCNLASCRPGPANKTPPPLGCCPPLLIAGEPLCAAPTDGSRQSSWPSEPRPRVSSRSSLTRRCPCRATASSGCKRSSADPTPELGRAREAIAIDEGNPDQNARLVVAVQKEGLRWRHLDHGENSPHDCFPTILHQSAPAGA